MEFFQKPPTCHSIVHNIEFYDAHIAQWADKGGQRILVCFHAFSLFFFDKNVTIMSRIDIIIHYSSFENLFTKEKSHFWCILSSWSLNFINNCNLLATSACLMLSGSNTYIKLKPAIYPTPTSPTSYIYTYIFDY